MAKAKNDMSKWASDIDTEATRTLISELQTEGKPYDKLEVGEKKYITNYRRICPKRPDWQNPYQVVPVHYLGPNNRQVVCLKEAGIGECPACTLRWELEGGGDKKAGQGLRPSIRTFLNVVKIDADGNLAEEKVFLLGLNQLQFLGKRGEQYDEDEEGDLPLFYFFEKYGDISHVETGRDLVLKAKKGKSGDFDVTVMKFAVADPSPFPGSSDLLEEGLINLPEAVSVVQPTEMMSIIEGRASGAMQIETPEETPRIEAPKSRFGGADAEEEEQAPAAEEPEEAPEDARASKTPPKTDPKAALARLHEQANGK